MIEPKLRFKADDGSDFPDWEEKKFLDCISKIVDFRGRTPLKLGMAWSGEKTEYLALSALNVKMGYIDENIDAHYGNKKLYDMWMDGNELYKGQVLFTTEAPMGNVAQVPDNKPYILSQRTIAFVPKYDLLHDDFLVVLLSSSNVQRRLDTLATGGTAKGISQKSLKNFNVKIPCDLDEQQKIADFLSTIDTIIEKQRATVSAWEERKKGVMQKLFSQEVRFKADDGSDFPDWEEKKLQSIVGKISSGKDKNEEGSAILYGSTGPIGTCANSTYKGRKILIARVGANAGALQYVLEDCGVTDNTLIITDTNSCNFKWLYCNLEHKNIGKMRFGGGQPLVTGTMLHELRMNVPCADEQQKIADCLSALDTVIQKQKETLEKWRELKKGLLQQMFV